MRTIILSLPAPFESISAWVKGNPVYLGVTGGPSTWTASRPEDEHEFVRRLVAKGIPTTVRDTRGSDIDGACGQLAAEVLVQTKGQG